jgi:hypothetical protein
MTQCPNCQTTLDGSYCPNCGQKNVDLERPVIDLAKTVIKETFELDGRAARTVETLFRHPGKLTSEFLGGRRRAYTPPLRLYLVISITFFVSISWFAGQGLFLDPAQTPGWESSDQAQFLSDTLPKLMFVLLPVFALILKAAYFSRLYFDHLIFSLHLHSAGYVVLAFMLPIENLANYHVGLAIAQAVMFIYFIAYFVMSLRRVYGSNWWLTSAKAFGILFGYMMAVSVAIEMTSTFLIMSD